MSISPFRSGPDVAASTAFFIVLTLCACVLLSWFLYKKQHRRAIIFVAPLVTVLGLHYGVYPEDVRSWLFQFSIAGRGVAAIMVTNYLCWEALRLLRHDNSFPVPLRQRLWVLGYFCCIVFLCYSCVFEELGLKETDGSITHNILTALYFTAVTWTTVGYGDVLPHDGWTRLFAAMAALNGYAVLAVLIATLLPIFMDEKLARDGTEL